MVEGTALSVAFAPGVTVTKWTRVWAERHPRIPLTVLPVDEAQQVAVVLDGTALLSFVRLPIDSERLHVIPLYRERVVVVAGKDHLFAAAEEVTLADVAGETQQNAGTKHHDRGPFDLVAAGVGVLVVPQSIARLQSRKDVVVRPITDAPEAQIALVWRADQQTDAADQAGTVDNQAAAQAELIADFIGIVRGRTAQSSRGATDRQGDAARQGGAAEQGATPKQGRASRQRGASNVARRTRVEPRKKHRGR